MTQQLDVTTRTPDARTPDPRTPARTSTDLGSAVVAPEQLPVGQLRASLDQDLWWWSKGVYALLGREQDALAPSTALLLHHVDPAHRAEVRAMLQEAPERGVAARIQVQTASRRPRTVILTLGPDGCPETERPSWLKRSVAGSLLDVTDSERHASTRAVRAATNHRATIEQAKGIAMTVYGLSEDAAFLLLSYFSQSRNLRLHQVAQQLVDQAARLTPGRDCRRLAEGILAGDQDAAARVPRS